jgi:hypothetical protein
MFFNEERIIVPKWGTLFGILFFVIVAAMESWEAWKRKGTLILSDIGIGKGGGTGFNPSGDMRIAKSHQEDKPSFAVVATGGFVFAGFAMNGNENFIVCPPEHIMVFSGNIMIKTHLRRVLYRQLPKYIQDELCKLPRFKKEFADKRDNLWFGMTSTYYGTDTQDNLKIEQKFLDNMALSNEYAHMLDNLIDKKSSIDKFLSNKNESRYRIVEQWRDEEK